MPADSLRTDIAIVGSGPGGSVTAALLAEAGRDVLLLEEGPRLPLESCKPFSLDEMVQKYRNGGLTVAMGRPKVQYVEGRCVGGGSEINSGLYHRTPPDILARWKEEFDLRDSLEEDLRPHFEANERELCVSPWPGELLPPSRKMQEGARKLGWKSLEVPRWFRYQERANPADPVVGEKQSMSKTFVLRALAAGCKLTAGVRIRSIRRDGNRWRLEGTSIADGANRSVSIEAQTVFLSAGAIQTPAILRRSGITKNVGNSLSMHPTVKLVATFPEDVNFPGLGVASHQVKEFSPDSSFGCSVSSVPYLALAMSDYPADAPAVLADWRRTLIYYAMTRGDGRGRIRALRSYADPLVRYQLSEQELSRLADGLRKLAELLFEAGAICMYPSVAGWKLASMDDLVNIPRQLPRVGSSLMTIHLFSSCPMGENAPRCAADSFGRVMGQKDLHIADASLLCTAPGVNPQGSLMAFARRNALRFLGRA
jgi:choline dehydrogenase-like flavoprotein